VILILIWNHFISDLSQHWPVITGGVRTVQCMWWGVGLVIERSRVRFPVAPPPGNDSGQVVHTHVWCVSITNQCNLVLAKGRWCSLAVKVTAGLAESNGSLSPGSWLCHLWTDCLKTWISSGVRTLRSLMQVWDYLCLILFHGRTRSPYL